MFAEICEKCSSPGLPHFWGENRILRVIRGLFREKAVHSTKYHTKCFPQMNGLSDSSIMSKFGFWTNYRKRKRPKPPLCKGRWHGVSRDGGIVAVQSYHFAGTLCEFVTFCRTIPQSASLTAPFTQGSLWNCRSGATTKFAQFSNLLI